jgi:hypothetical protein
MTEHRDEELSREELEAFRSLAEIRRLPTRDEDRIVRALRKRGLIKPSHRRVWHRFAQAAAIAAVLVVTFYLGMEYGSHSANSVGSNLEPAREATPATDDLLTTRTPPQIPSSLEDYRDEPDPPETGRVLFAKTNE